MGGPVGGPVGARLAALLRDPPRAAVLGACGAVLGLRRAQAWSHPQFWAEDVLFYRQALEGGARAILAASSGYTDVLLRAVAALAALGDPAWAPALFVGAATLGTLYVCGLALSRRSPLPRFGGLGALAVVLVPDTREVLLTVVNLQWVLAAGLILVLVSSDPVSPAQWAHDAAACLLLGLTGPFCLLLAPLFLLRAWHSRTRAAALLAALIGACAAVQYAFVRAQPAVTVWDPEGAVVAWRLILPAIGRRLGGSLLLGFLLSPRTGLAAGTACGALTLAGIAWLAAAHGANRRLRVFLGLATALILAGVLYRTRHSLILFFYPSRARYFYLPQLAVLWLLLASAARAGSTARVARLLAAWALAVNLPRLREPAYPDLRWGDYARPIREGRAITVPTNPAPWTTRFGPPGR